MRRHFYIPIHMAKIQNTEAPNSGENIKQQEVSIDNWMQNGTTTL